MIGAVLRNLVKILLGLLALSGLVLLLPRLITELYSLPRIKSAQNVAKAQAAIVFGAGLWRDGSPTPVLRDRVQTATELYFAGKVDKLIMSGTMVGYYNEPRAMRNFAMELGVPNEAIYQDLAGLRTYDTCYRAKKLFGVEKAIVVTQRFHLPRALYVCNALGVESQGVAADLRAYRQRSQAWWNLRELPATLVALWEVHVQPPQIVTGDPDTAQ